MKNTRVAGVVLLFAAAVSGLAYERPQWATDLGVDFWNLPDLESQVDEAQRIRDELEKRSTATIQRMADKQAIVDALIDERISFRDAAIQVHRLNRGTPVRTALRLQYPDMSESEACCRNLIDITLRDRRAQPEQELLSRKLHSELARLIAQGDGQVQLPD